MNFWMYYFRAVGHLAFSVRCYAVMVRVNVRLGTNLKQSCTPPRRAAADNFFTPPPPISDGALYDDAADLFWLERCGVFRCVKYLFLPAADIHVALFILATYLSHTEVSHAAC
jgi:hypothetical protein